MGMPLKTCHARATFEFYDQLEEAASAVKETCLLPGGRALRQNGVVRTQPACISGIRCS